MPKPVAMFRFAADRRRRGHIACSRQHPLGRQLVRVAWCNEVFRGLASGVRDVVTNHEPLGVPAIRIGADVLPGGECQCEGHYQRHQDSQNTVTGHVSSSRVGRTAAAGVGNGTGSGLLADYRGLGPAFRPPTHEVK
jgi:hypothetical protein